MKHQTLREIAKVGVGLFIADVVCGLWLSSAGLLPISILGVSWGASAIMPGVIFDLAVILLLSHYAWNMRLPISSPSERGLLKLAGLIFLIVALVHLMRLMFGWNLIIDTVVVPLWLSWFGVIIPGYLSYTSFHFALKR